MNLSSKIYVAGHRGLLGSALVRRLHARGYSNLVVRTRSELDLTLPEGLEKTYQDYLRHGALAPDSHSVSTIAV